MNEQLLMIYLEKVQVKSFSKPKWVAKMLDKYVLALTLTREMLQQASRIVRGRDTDTAEISARRDSINYLLGQMGITPAKTKEKKQEIKRGNPWVQ